jgi:CRP/FNR family transcriptional regulator, nitrogen fixation regulation protein
MWTVPVFPSALRLDRAPPASVSTRSSAPADPIELAGLTVPFGRNAEIYGEGEGVDQLYRVVSGVVRTCRILLDGRRQIGAFYLPGDMFGLETAGKHRFSAEAVIGANLLVVRRSHLLSSQLWSLMIAELERAQDHLVLLVKTAPERVASFLLEMARHIPSSNAIELRHVAPGHRRLSGPDRRDRLAHADAT